MTTSPLAIVAVKVTLTIWKYQLKNRVLEWGKFQVMETKASLFPTRVKIQCWMILLLSRGPITVYPKLHQTWTRVSPKSSGASATRAKTIRGFSKIWLSYPMAHQAKIFKIINSLGKPTTPYNIWTRTLTTVPKGWWSKVLSWTLLKMEWKWCRELEPLKLVKTFKVSNQKFHPWMVSKVITVIERLESTQRKYMVVLIHKEATLTIPTRALSLDPRIRLLSKA